MWVRELRQVKQGKLAITLRKGNDSLRSLIYVMDFVNSHAIRAIQSTKIDFQTVSQRHSFDTHAFQTSRATMAVAVVGVAMYNILHLSKQETNLISFLLLLLATTCTGV